MLQRQIILPGHIFIYYTEEHKSVEMNSEKEYKQNKAEMTTEALQRKTEFKRRGAKVIPEPLINDGDFFVEKMLSNQNNAWYNGASIEASLKCMEALNQNCSMEEAYTKINSQNPNVPCTHLGMKLSEWQNDLAERIVIYYHKRGLDFYQYRNSSTNKHTNIEQQKTYRR